MADLMNALSISSYGMKAQGARIKVISENVANADTTSLTPGGDPYTRKTISFKNVLDRETKTDQVQVNKIEQKHKEPFALKYMPDNPGADPATGMVKMPNVNSLVELMDMREAQRSYEANLGMIEQDRSMVNATIDLLRH
jgi:flagellar basal-body rod protein FlgC